jgi:uncharacterized membrane protein YbhN (UPF0104 family)
MNVEAGPTFDVTPRRLAVLGLFAVLVIIALYLLLPRVAGLEDTWHRISAGEPVWLVAAGVLTVGMFGGYVLQFHGTYRAGLSWRESLQVTMAALAASRILSAGGAGGLVLQSWALRRAGLEARVVADRTVGFIVLQYLVYTSAVALFGFALYFGVLPGKAPFAVTFVPAVLAVVITALGLSLGFVPPDLQKRLGSRLANLPAAASAGVRLALARVRHPDATVLGAILFWAFQIAVLWASFEAFGDAPPVAVLVVGFFVGMLGNLLPLPGGIGGVDGGMIGAFVALGLDSGLALVAVLTFRGFTFWLPTVPGVIAFVALRKTVDAWSNDQAPTYT